MPDPTPSDAPVDIEIKGVAYYYKQGLTAYGSQQVGAWADVKPGQDPSQVMVQLQKWVLNHVPEQ